MCFCKGVVLGMPSSNQKQYFFKDLIIRANVGKIFRMLIFLLVSALATPLVLKVVFQINLVQ